NLLAQERVLLRFGFGQAYFVPNGRNRRQVAQHLGFGATQHVRTDEFTQGGPHGLVTLAFTRTPTALLKRLPGSKQLRIQKVKDAPQIHQMILDWGARGYDSKPRREAVRGLGSQ